MRCNEHVEAFKSRLKIFVSTWFVSSSPQKLKMLKRLNSSSVALLETPGLGNEPDEFERE